MNVKFKCTSSTTIEVSDYLKNNNNKCFSAYKPYLTVHNVSDNIIHNENIIYFKVKKRFK